MFLSIAIKAIPKLSVYLSATHSHLPDRSGLFQNAVNHNGGYLVDLVNGDSNRYVPGSQPA